MPQNEARKGFLSLVHPVGSSAVWCEPFYVRVGVENFSSQNRMGSTERDHSSCEALNLVVLPYQTPVKPAHFVILAVRVIVSVLTSAKLIAAQQHWNASRDKKGQQEILDQAVPHSLDSCIIACAFHPAIVAVISIGSIAVVLAIFVIVLLLV